MLTYRARCWLNWLGEITQRCEIMSNQTRHQQSRIWFGWLHSDCYIPDITVMRTDCPHAIFFFFVNRLLSQLVSVTWVDGWNKGRRGGGGPEAQASGVNRCVGSLPCWNGSSSRCTAAGCGSQSYIYIHPASRPVLKYWISGKEGEAGWVGLLRKFNLTLP